MGVSIGRLRMRFALCVLTTVLAASCGQRTADHPNSDVPPSSPDAERNDIHRTFVSSSALRSVGYEEEQRVLEIEFPGGEVYRYFDVPPDVHRGLMTARSAGRYFHQRIRGVYEYKRVEESETLE